jgi:FtsZ-interacting cell division protein ZipA
MSAGAIIAIVIGALIILALLAFVIPRMRRRQAQAARERELDRRREHEVERHRDEAETRGLRADEAEQRARIAAKEAEVERAQAEAHEARATMHERGLADEELMGDRDDDAAATRGEHGERFGRDGEVAGRRRDEPIASSTTRPDTDYERGRRDEARDRER